MWHPIGGLASTEKFCALNDALQKIDGAEMRLAPDETAYIINLTGSEAKQILELTDDSAKLRLRLLSAVSVHRFVR